jgi:sigma-E factor negative regulatory protein RseA
MTEQEYERLSALVDNELPRDEIAGEINKLYQSKEAKDGWANFHLIGDAMRRDMGASYSPSFAAEISRRIQDEPVILAPGAMQPPSPSRKKTLVSLAVAASMVGAAVLIAPQLISPEGADTPQQIAQTIPDATPDAESKTYYISQNGTRWELLKKPEVESKLNAYLVNHREHSPSGKIKGILPYATFVSYDGNKKVGKQ